MEGKSVGGALRLEGEEEVVEGGENAEEEVAVDGIEAVDTFDEKEHELETRTQQSPKNLKKRPLDDLTPDTSASQTPKMKEKKQNQSSQLISTSNAEAISDPTGGIALTAPETDDWQDPDAFALAQNEMNTNDAVRPEGDVFEGSGQNDAGGGEQLHFEDFDAGNEIEEDRHPGANLPQPHNEEEERELVSIRLEGTGEVVDPRESGTPMPTSKKKEKKEKKEKHKTPAMETTPAAPSSTVPKSEKKKKDKKSKHRDQSSSPNKGAAGASSQPSKISTPSKAAVNTEGTDRSLSKDERKKLKKLRSKDTKSTVRRGT